MLLVFFHCKYTYLIYWLKPAFLNYFNWVNRMQFVNMNGSLNVGISPHSSGIKRAWRFGCEHEQFDTDIVWEFRISPDMQCSHVKPTFVSKFRSLFAQNKTRVFVVRMCMLVEHETNGTIHWSMNCNTQKHTIKSFANIWSWKWNILHDSST